MPSVTSPLSTRRLPTTVRTGLTEVQPSADGAGIEIVAHRVAPVSGASASTSTDPSSWCAATNTLVPSVATSVTSDTTPGRAVSQTDAPVPVARAVTVAIDVPDEPSTPARNTVPLSTIGSPDATTGSCAR